MVSGHGLWGTTVDRVVGKTSWKRHVGRDLSESEPRENLRVELSG